jgi:hypothetical protein
VDSPRVRGTDGRIGILELDLEKGPTRVVEAAHIRDCGRVVAAQDFGAAVPANETGLGSHEEVHRGQGQQASRGVGRQCFWNGINSTDFSVALHLGERWILIHKGTVRTS